MSPSAKRGVYLDYIVELSEPLSATESLSPLVHLLTLAYRVQKPPRQKQDRLLTLLRTIRSCSPASSPSSGADSPRRILLNSYVHFLSPVLNGYAGMEDFEARVNAFSQPGEFREFWELDGRNLISEMVGGDGSPPPGGGDTMAGMDMPFLARFGGDTGRRVGLTRDGRLVCVDGGAREGDEVWEEGEGGEGLVLRRGGEALGLVSCDSLAWQ